MSDIPWSAGLLLLAAAAGLLSIIAVWAPAYFHPEKREVRAIKRRRKKRRNALKLLRATASRDIYREFSR